jgi:leader peptidase (prepilin peptidase)/N-methyltransferase
MPFALPVTHPIILGFTFAFGAVIGSFLNVCIYRLPMRQSVNRPSWSYCFSCGERLRFWDLIPLLSALALRFRCRHCGRRFSPQYFLVELLTACWFVAVMYTFGTQPVLGPTDRSLHLLSAVACMVAGAALLVALFIDLRHFLIPDEVIWVMGITGVVWDVGRLAWGASGWGPLMFNDALGTGSSMVYLPRSVVGMAVGAGFLYAVAWVFDRVFHKESMGFGDVKLAGAMGALLGPGYVFLSWFLWATFLGAILGIITIVVWKLRGERARMRPIPFGPMLAISGLAHLAWGPAVLGGVLHWYLSVSGLAS